MRMIECRFRNYRVFREVEDTNRRKELEADDHQVDAIYEKFMLLDTSKKDMIETMVDALLKGEDIIIQIK